MILINLDLIKESVNVKMTTKIIHFDLNL